MVICKHLNFQRFLISIKILYNVTMCGGETNPAEKCVDNFKYKFKYYKSNRPKPSLQDVITVEHGDTKHITSLLNEDFHDNRVELLGLLPQKQWSVYSFPRHPGLLMIRNPFTNIGQRYWIRRCLEEYPKKPNKTSIDVEIHIDDWWECCYKGETINHNLLKKLRWTTLGYHHDWDTKIYSEKNKSQFPEDLAELSDIIAKYINSNNYRAEAAIVNYYHMDSTLSAHTDHSELDLSAPLFSFSFGQSAIFLIGGQSKSVEPSGILLNSGDILVMSKEARLCYHAVPRILPGSSTPWTNCEPLEVDPSALPNFKYIRDITGMIENIKRNMDNKQWSRFQDYIHDSRINMNVRQVLNEKQSNLN